MKLNICNIFITIFITILLLGISILLGWWSTNGKTDIICNISVNIVSILLPLLVLHTTLIIQLLNEIRRYAKERKNVNFHKVIKAIKCNFVAEITILFSAIIVLVANQYLKTINTTACALWNWIVDKSQIITNGFVIFAMLYFMWIIVDEILAFLKLFIENSNDESVSNK